MDKFPTKLEDKRDSSKLFDVDLSYEEKIEYYKFLLNNASSQNKEEILEILSLLVKEEKHE